MRKYIAMDAPLGIAARVRHGTAIEVPKAAAIWERAHEVRLGRIPEAARRGRGEAVLRDRIPSPNARFLVAEAKGALIGMILGNDARENDGEGLIMPGVLHISYVAVDPPYWRKGIASRLLERLIGEARQRRYPRVQLWVVTSNDSARMLYERFGFAPTGREKMDDHGEHIVHYALGEG